MISSCVNPNSERAVLSLSVAPLRTHSSPYGSISGHPLAHGLGVLSSTDTDGLLLGLDHGHDALLLPRVGRADVFGGQLVDDLPGRVALKPFCDPPPDDNRLERVVGGRDGQRHPRVAAQVARLARARTGEEDDPVAVGADPQWNGMGRAIREDGREVRDRGAVEYAAHVGVKHGVLLQRGSKRVSEPAGDQDHRTTSQRRWVTPGAGTASSAGKYGTICQPNARLPGCAGQDGGSA